MAGKQIMESFSNESKKSLNRISNGKKDVIQEIPDLMNENSIEYCIIGGLAVNAYVEPVASLDLDIVVTVDGLDKLITFDINAGSDKPTSCQVI